MVVKVKELVTSLLALGLQRSKERRVPRQSHSEESDQRAFSGRRVRPLPVVGVERTRACMSWGVNRLGTPTK